MLTDANKMLHILSYNYLNLPDSIDFENDIKIKYLYASGGAKLRQVTYNNGTPTEQLDYSGAFVYENSSLKFILTSEGRLLPTANGFEREYFLSDHLGNTRVVFKKSGDSALIIQENHYYAYGMEIADQSFSSTPVPNTFLYNGKEYDQNTGYYQYGFRQYDAQIGRWWVVDAMSEKYYSHSSYAYCLNNPIKYYDVDGLFANPGFNYNVWNLIASVWNRTPDDGHGYWSESTGFLVPDYGSGTYYGERAEGSRYVFDWQKGKGLWQNIWAFLKGPSGPNFNLFYRVAKDPPTVIGIYAHEAFFEYVRKNLDRRFWSVKNAHPDGIIDDLRYYGPNKKGSIWDIKSMTGDINIYAFFKDLKDIYPYLYSANFYKIDGYTWSLGSSNGNPKPFEGILPIRWGEYTFFYYIPNPNNGIIYYDYFVNVPQKQIETVPKKEPGINPVFLPIAAPRAILEPAFGILFPLFGFPVFMQHQSVNDFQQPGT